MSSVRLQCASECGDGLSGYWILDGNEILATASCKENGEQIAAALNTAPGQAASREERLTSLGYEAVPPEQRDPFVRPMAPGQVAEGRPDGWRWSNEQQKLVPCPDPEPAGEQRRCVERTHFAAPCGPDCEMPAALPDLQPAETTQGGEPDDVTHAEVESFYRIAEQVDAEQQLAKRIIDVVRSSGLEWESGLAVKLAQALAPADPDEEQRLLRELERHARQMIDRTSLRPSIFGDCLAQLDALRAARETKP